MKTKTQVRVNSAASLSEMNQIQGMLGKETVEVLRGTRCSGVIVKKILVPKEAYTGRNQTMFIVDCTSRVLPDANVSIDTPYYKGEVLALCLENLLVDLIVDNIPGAGERTDLDINRVPTLAIQTRAQSRQLDQSETLKTPEIISQGMTPTQIYNAQKEDPCLKKIKTMCDSNEVRGKASRRTIYTGSSVHPMLSVVGICTVDSTAAVPQDVHETGTRIIYGRSFSDQKNYSESVIRILLSFWQSCDICQRTVRGLFGKFVESGHKMFKYRYTRFIF